MPPADKK